MANIGNFDATSVEPSAPAQVLPPGDYVAQIVNSEMRDTKTGNGQYLWLEFDIIDGDHTGRKLWDRLNLVNQNQQAVEIAQRALSALCHATGKLQVSDSEQLHYIPVTVTVKVRPAGPDRSGITRDATNEIRGYKPANGSAAKPAPISRPAVTAPAAKTVSTPPWKRAG